MRSVTLVGLVYAVTLTKMLWRPELLTELELKAPSKHGLRRVLFHDVAPVTRELLGNERISWLRGLPMRWSGHDLTVLHASPDNLWRAPLADAPDSELLEVYGGLESEAVVYGHIHRPFVRELGRSAVANSGSVGLNYDGDQRARYAIVTDGEVSIRRVEYDVEREIRELPNVRAVIDGRYSNEARAERKHYQKLLQRCREMLATINRR